MTDLFEPITINGMTLKNRFVRSATWEGMAGADGSVTDRLIETMTELARGAVGLIISGHTYVQPEGQAGPYQMSVCSDDRVPGLARMTEAVHAAGGTIVMQLAHAGRFAATSLSGLPALAVSEPEPAPESPVHVVREEEIDSIVAAFAAGARRAKSAGFDGVQLHSAHGYFLNQWLSPLFNRRKDGYGGAIENRARIHTEIVRAVRRSVGPDFPLLIKLNSEDFAAGGLTLAESIRTAEMLAEAGLDAIELSGGLLTNKKTSPSRMGINRPEKEAYFREQAAALKQAVSLPLILVGGIRSLEVAESLVETGSADLISMSRPLIREPGLIARWQKGDRRPAACLSDNQCFRPGMEGRGVYCVTAAKAQES